MKKLLTLPMICAQTSHAHDGATGMECVLLVSAAPVTAPPPVAAVAPEPAAPNPLSNLLDRIKAEANPPPPPTPPVLPAWKM